MYAQILVILILISESPIPRRSQWARKAWQPMGAQRTQPGALAVRRATYSRLKKDRAIIQQQALAADIATMQATGGSSHRIQAILISSTIPTRDSSAERACPVRAPRPTPSGAGGESTPTCLPTCSLHFSRPFLSCLLPLVLSLAPLPPLQLSFASPPPPSSFLSRQASILPFPVESQFQTQTPTTSVVSLPSCAACRNGPCRRGCCHPRLDLGSSGPGMPTEVVLQYSRREAKP